MAKIRTQSFYKFCLTVAKVHKYERLSIADKLKLEKAYQEYQIAIYLIAIENKLQIKPVLEYLDDLTEEAGGKVRGMINPSDQLMSGFQ
ncbi:hypothetical protein KEM48_006097 [Puccinia striiformis f. sp. tritici PST-130]|nr:hypothetical protein KEM48_006097 [Puccinia striiformis f. sp. tritici PST-130]